MSTTDATTETPALALEKSTAGVAVADQLREAATTTGRPAQQLVWELGRLSTGAGRIAIEDYMALRLFDPALPDEARAAFVGRSAGKLIARHLNYNQHWLAVAGHKLVAESVLRGFGFPTPQTRAIFAKGCAYPAFAMLRSEADIAAYLRDNAAYPLFGKPISGSLSLGTIGILDIDRAKGSLTLSNGKSQDIAALAAEIVANYADGYLFQDMLRPAPELVQLGCRHIPTVRFYTLNGGEGPKVFRAAMKMPVGANMADNYWREGNILAGLDLATGTITRATAGAGTRQIVVERHPISKSSLVGFQLPQWQAASQLVVAAAETLDELPFIGWDVALTDKGPVVVELNDSPDVSLAQIADRRGLRDEQLAKAMAWVDRINAAFAEQERAAAKAKPGLMGALKRVFG